MTTTDIMDVVFPPSNKPKMRKLIIRNNSTCVLVAKIKTPEYKRKNLGVIVQPNGSQEIMLVLIPKNYAENFSPEKQLGQTFLLLKDNDYVEIYCRPLSLDASSDIAQKRRYRMHPYGQTGEYRLKYTTKLEDLSQLSMKKQEKWWVYYLTSYAKKNQDRINELIRWTSLDLNEPERLAHKLQAVRDYKRFSAPTVLVEIPGKASLVESITEPLESVDDSNCITACIFDDDTTTAKPFNKTQLLSMAASTSQCGTARPIGGIQPCDWLSQWLGWFLPINVKG